MSIGEKGPHVIQNGLLEVSGGHHLYWEEWGNQHAFPIMHLHGGPGSNFSDSHKSLYNPEKHHVIFFDQRGCGRSTPFAEIAHNTTQDLIRDVESLRGHLEIEKMYIAGGSWGSTLALFYALAHPERIKRMMLWSAYLARQFETDFVNEGYSRYFFPDAWDRFIALVPKDFGTNGDNVMRFYAEHINSKDIEVSTRYANEWTLWESTLSSIAYDPHELEREVFEDKRNIAIARLETHYFLNKCFVPENYILDHIQTIKDIPCDLVQGRFDMCTPPVSARDLCKAYGAHLKLHWVNSGHLRSDPEMFAALKMIARENLT